MTNRLAFQTQLASIMEVLANAAVAEICKLVDDDYAVVSLQMSQCQRENKALKRKLHLLELKMARGNAERRLRDSAANSGGNGRTRVHIGGGDRFRETAAPTGGVFDQQVDVGSWSGKDAATGCTINQAIHSDDMLPKSPDVGLEEHKELLVKEENVEANKVEEPEEDVPLIGDDGVLEIVHRGASGQSARPGQQDNHPQTSRARPPSGSSRGVEVSDSSPVLNCPPSTCAEGTGSLQDTIASSQYVDDGNSDSQFDVLCDSNKSANSLVGDIFDEPPGAELEGPKLSSSFSLAAADFPSTSSSVNGWARYNSSFMMPQPLGNNDRGGTSSALHHRKERLFVCSFCGKAFNRPKKVEIHQRIHTGERPFSCSTCGKMFSEAGNLRKHQRVHTGEKPYSCRLCGKGFAWIRNLKTHQQKNHPEYQSEDVAEELT